MALEATESLLNIGSQKTQHDPFVRKASSSERDSFKDAMASQHPAKKAESSERSSKPDSETQASNVNSKPEAKKQENHSSSEVGSVDKSARELSHSTNANGHQSSVPAEKTNNGSVGTEQSSINQEQGEGNLGSELTGSMDSVESPLLMEGIASLPSGGLEQASSIGVWNKFGLSAEPQPKSGVGVQPNALAQLKSESKLAAGVDQSKLLQGTAVYVNQNGVATGGAAAMLAGESLSAAVPNYSSAQLGQNLSGATEFKGHASFNLSQANSGEDSLTGSELDLKLGGTKLTDTLATDSKTLDVKPAALNGLQSTVGLRNMLAQNTASKEPLAGAVISSLEGAQNSESSSSQAGNQSLIASSVNSPLTTAPKLSMPATVSFGQPAWAAMVADRAASMALQNIQFAEIQLDPAELGPLNIKVSVQNDQASVAFSSAHVQVRDALDQSLARLKDMLAEEGVELVESSVADDTEQNAKDSDLANGDGKEDGNEPGSDAQGLADDAEPVTQLSVQASYGIDSYA